MKKSTLIKLGVLVGIHAGFAAWAQIINFHGALAPATAFAANLPASGTPAANPANGPVAVLTQHNDNARTGMNLNETLLNISNVNTSQFGLIYTLAVDDQIYAQPLVATNVNLGANGTHNIVVVATVNDTVYAFDADNPAVTTPYWTNTFIAPPNIVPVANTDLSAVGACGGGYSDFSGNMGIVGAPVIDPVAGTIYLVARTKETSGQTTTFVQRLHALDITTGKDRTNSPVVITATYPGTSSDSVGGVITFDPLRQNQRSALALVNGLVYIAWTSHCDLTPYHGWVIAYNQTNLHPVAIYNDTPNGIQAGIWMSNQGPAADTNGNIYISTGNGDVDAVDRGESFMKLTLSGTNLNVASWFTPFNYQDLNQTDLDLGSGGVLLVPGTSLLFSGGKGGRAYLVNRDNMGGLSAGNADTNIVQSFQVTSDELHGGAVWWDGPGASFGYLWPASVHLQQYQFDRSNGVFVLPTFAQGPTAAPIGQPGGILALSANGTNAGSGIVWASHQVGGDANQQVLPGILHAYNAQNVSQELWNSSQNSARDGVGNFAKFVAPTVANGKVYLATFSSRLNVYGLLASAAAPQLSVSPTNLGFGPVIVGQTNTQNFQVSNAGGLTLSGTAATAAPFSISGGSPFNLGFGQSGAVLVSFSPTSLGTFTNTVVFASNGGSSTNTVTGTGVTVTITIQPVGSQIQLNWPSGTLQSADQAAGPYSDISDATSPYLVTPSVTQQFYRVRLR